MIIVCSTTTNGDNTISIDEKMLRASFAAKLSICSDEDQLKYIQKYGITVPLPNIENGLGFIVHEHLSLSDDISNEEAGDQKKNKNCIPVDFLCAISGEILVIEKVTLSSS